METVTEARYVLPLATEMYKPWEGRNTRTFKPNENQMLVIGAVKIALQSGLYYSNEVREFCARQLALCAADIDANFSKAPTEGGIFGMECYHARQHLDSVMRHAAIDQAQLELAPYAGKKLGTLMFNDFKRKTLVEVTNVEGDLLSLQGKQGKYKVEFTTDALSVSCAMDRAAEKGLRKQNFKQFIALGA